MTTKTPAQILAIDTKLADMWLAYWLVVDRADPLHARIAQARKMVRAGYDRQGDYTAEIAEAQAKVEEIMVEARPLADAARAYDEAEYDGWIRYYTVPDGHIHFRGCHTLRPTTRVGWTPSLSGKDEAAAVELLGPTLCTHCFPSAPLSWTQGDQKPGMCPGQRDYDGPSRTGYYAGNWGTCNTCGGHITITSTGKLRAHKAAE